MRDFLADWFSDLKPIRKFLGGHWERWKPLGPGRPVWVQVTKCSNDTGTAPLWCSPLWRPKCEEYPK